MKSQLINWIKIIDLEKIRHKLKFAYREDFENKIITELYELSKI
jgi:hypothetical protein